jgi:hypothetical protein
MMSISGRPARRRRDRGSTAVMGALVTAAASVAVAWALAVRLAVLPPSGRPDAR